MGEAIDTGRGETTALQVESYDDMDSAVFFGTKTPQQVEEEDLARKTLETNKEPEVSESIESEQSEEQGGSTEEGETEPEKYTIELGGQTIEVSKEAYDDFQEKNAGYMKDADYRKKTAKLADQRRKLEEIYGPFDQVVTEPAVPAVVPESTGEPEEFNPFDKKALVGLFSEVLDQRDQVGKTKTIQAKEGALKSEVWSDLQKDHSDLKDETSLLYKTATEILQNMDPHMARSPFCDRYAVIEAIHILGPSYRAKAEADAKKKIVQTLGQPGPTPGGPKGSDDKAADDILSAEEERLNKIPEHVAALELNDADFRKWEIATTKSRRVRRVQ